MKKTFTFSTMVVATLALFFTMRVAAQIADLDPSKYYLIINHSVGQNPNGKNAIAIDHERVMEEGALVEQQEPNEFLPTQLWQFIPITDSTYYIINFGTGMALGLSDWRGPNPFWTGAASPTSEEKDAALMVPSFIWNGSHPGVVQRTFSEGEPTQIWQPSLFPNNTTSGDTTFYRMTLAMNLADSGFAFNIWERRVLPGYRNICIFPGAGPAEPALYNDGNSLYSYRFVKTSQDISNTGKFLQEKINVYTRDGSIILSGELYGKNVEVYSILGTQVYSARVNASELYIPARQGLYIVKAGNLVTKLVVR